MALPLALFVPQLLAALLAAEPQESAGPPQLPEAPDAPPGEVEEPEDAIELARPKTSDERLEELEAKVEELEIRLRQAETLSIKDTPITFHGYVDFGFFATQGNGAGWTQDVGNLQFPELAGRYGWVFLGDILATSVNSRGEAADLGDAPGADRFDSVASGGAPGFLVNEVSFRVNVAVAKSAILEASVNFVPRTGSEFSLGDFIEVDIAQLEWVVFDETSLFAGKVDPVFGIEYKDRRADARFGVTPSLIARYTSGPQLGVKARSKLFDGWLILAAAFTNDSPTTEQFHFKSEVDRNAGKTASGRAAIHVPIESLFETLGGHALEIGLSGAWGPQDRARDDDGDIWFIGADLTYSTVDFALKAQWIRGRADGSVIDGVPSLNLRGSGYVEIDWMVLPALGVLARAELRDAFVAFGTERAYLTKSWRVTAGARAVITSSILVKAEYLKNGEFDGIEEFANDVFTTSLLLHY